MQEIWKDIKGYEGIYQVSSYGNVKSFIGKEKMLKIAKSTKRTDGKMRYPKLNLKGKTFYLHRLVAETFLDNPNNKIEVNHIDRNIDNCRVDNLEWNTANENISHKTGKPNMDIFSNLIKLEINRLIPIT